MARFDLALLLSDRRAVLAFSRLVASGVDSADALGRVFFSLEFPDLDGIEGRRWVSQDPGRSRRTSDS